MQIIQWAEHHYPSFLAIESGEGGARTAIDPMSRDARVPLYLSIAKREQEKALKIKQEQTLADLKARGILKDRTPEEEEVLRLQREADSGISMFVVFGIIVGVLLSMVALGAGLTWAVIKIWG